MDPDLTTDQLCDRGLLALEEERWEDAIAAAQALRNRRYSATFEIEARARAGLGELDRAIELLEEGVERAPDASPLWHWLGCFRSDAGRFEAALEAFEREADFADASATTNTYNVAVVHERMGRADEALAILDRAEITATDGPPAAAFDALRARLLVPAGRPDEAEALATRCIEQQEALSPDDYDNEVTAGAYVARGRARLAMGRGSEAIEDALDAFWRDPDGHPEPALQLIRDAEGIRSPGARYLKLLVHGRITADDQEMAFYMSGYVVAPDERAAMDYLARLLPDESAASLELTEWEDDGPAAEELDGVVRCGELHCYDPDAPDADAAP